MPVLTNRTNLNIRRYIEIDAVLEERRRIRREMHDGVAQALNYLNLKAGAVRSALSANQVEKASTGIEDMHSVVRSTYEDIREFLDQLTDEAVTHPLIPTLLEYTYQYSQRYGIQVEFEAPGVLRNLSPHGELQLLRIAQEALTNVRKHAQASRVHLKLEDTDRGVELWVKDDGQGIPMENPSSLDLLNHHGLSIMKDRAEGLGGTLEVRAGPGQGMEIHVTVPRQKVRL